MAEETPAYKHAFKNGRIVEIVPAQRVTLALIRTALDKKYPMPTPPKNETELGEIENTADPDYIKALQEWEQKQRNRVQLHILRFVIRFPDAAEIRADLNALEADRLRLAEYLAEYDMTPPTFNEAEPDAELVAEMDDSSKRLTWLYWVACQASPDEIIELLRAIGDISDQEGQIKAVQATFPA